MEIEELEQKKESEYKQCMDCGNKVLYKYNRCYTCNIVFKEKKETECMDCKKKTIEDKFERCFTCNSKEKKSNKSLVSI
jgi:DNA-directed RNA polymerase subunit RPC12/RpoP